MIMNARARTAFRISDPREMLRLDRSKFQSLVCLTIVLFVTRSATRRGSPRRTTSSSFGCRQWSSRRSCVTVRTNSAFLDSSSSCMVDGTQNEYSVQNSSSVAVVCSEFPMCCRIVVLDVITMDAAFGACALAVSRCHVVPIARYAYQFALQLLVFLRGTVCSLMLLVASMSYKIRMRLNDRIPRRLRQALATSPYFGFSHQ